MSIAADIDSPKSMEQQLFDHRRELARMRNLQALAEARERTEPFAAVAPQQPRWIPLLYQDRLQLDPKRPVLDRWKSLTIDFTGFHYRRFGNKIDPDPSQLVEPNSPLRVRVLDEIDRGAVLDLNPLEYFEARAQAQNNPNLPDFEPVPDKTGICGPYKRVPLSAWQQECLRDASRYFGRPADCLMHREAARFASLAYAASQRGLDVFRMLDE